ncbi:EAL domain-containing protein [Pseudaeromonas paramecii]|uniref:RNase E specificity factor CsrD n=1 Tax=Pseudaeromonas paramecii TaxID=2138166 RepID=A0ABP8QJM9_9GAMM
MKLINQIAAFLALCVIATVMVVMTSMALSFHYLAEGFLERELQAVVRIIEEDGLSRRQLPSLTVWLPPILKANRVKQVEIAFRGEPLFSFHDNEQPDPGDPAQKLLVKRLHGERYPALQVSFYVLPPLSDLEYLQGPLFGITAGIALVSLGVWLATAWLRRQLRGAVLLAERSELILNDQLGRLKHDPANEWPEAASQALDRLLGELKEARKERGRFDMFIRRKVFIDKQLGIGNRLFFSNRLEAAMADPASGVGGVLLFELAALGQINRQHGDAEGDLVLQHCVRYLQAFVGKQPGALLARHDGGRFALLLINAAEAEVELLARQLLKSLLRLPLPADVDPEQCLFIGGVCYQPGESAQRLLEQAEQALRSARLEGGSGVFLYEKPLQVEALATGSVRWRSRLERQLQQGQLPFAVQPVLAEPNGRAEQGEMLVRLEDEQGEPLPASGVMAMVDKVGLQLAFDRLMLQQALERLADTPMPLSVNLHVESLLDRAFTRALVMALVRLGRDTASHLIIEINESLIGRHQAALRRPLRSLRLLGCRLTVDQAGREVQSTDYVRDFSLDFLKLHPSLVREIHNRPLNQMAVHSLVGGCDNDHTRVIAVGVETEAEWRCLRGLGVSLGQGFWLATPAEPLAKPPKRRKRELVGK